MDKCHPNGIMTFTAGGAIAKGEFVKFSSAKVVKTTAANDQAIGVALDATSADGDLIPVAILGCHPGTVQIKAGGAITKGAQIAANGTATAAATDVICGVALEAATASGDIIEIAHQVGQIK